MFNKRTFYFLYITLFCCFLSFYIVYNLMYNSIYLHFSILKTDFFVFKWWRHLSYVCGRIRQTNCFKFLSKYIFIVKIVILSSFYMNNNNLKSYVILINRLWTLDMRHLDIALSYLVSYIPSLWFWRVGISQPLSHPSVVDWSRCVRLETMARSHCLPKVH